MRICLILLDGLRGDALAALAEAQPLLQKASYTLQATTVMPSVTLPCHMSLFHSVDPARHGTVTNTYMPQVRPIDGLCEVLSRAEKRCGLYFDWEELRDLARPGSLAHMQFRSGGRYGYAATNDLLCEEVIRDIPALDLDFTFFYMGYPDAAGHDYGWMSPEYFASLRHCWRNVEKLYDRLPADTLFLLTADHGGHARAHGNDIPEDMVIPIAAFSKGTLPQFDWREANICDLAPTIVRLLQLPPAREWEGHTLCKESC